MQIYIKLAMTAAQCEKKRRAGEQSKLYSHINTQILLALALLTLFKHVLSFLARRGRWAAFSE